MESPLNPLLVVDDEEAARYAARRVFEGEFQVLEAGSAEEARPLIEKDRPPVILLDYNLPGEDGLSLLRDLTALPNPPAVILITAYGSERLAVQALKSGAYDYLSKPYDIAELRAVVARAIERQDLRREVEQLRTVLAAEGQFGAMVGDCPKMREVFRTAATVAATNLPVLILGESGTGKDLLARAIHEKSLRARGRFVALNCSALPESLVESELFGYQKGAFTGAVQSNVGRFEAAHRGTIFLDEIADLALAVQPKLLRVAESGAFERLGATTSTQVDVRVISATNADLPAMVQQGKFREDLYYRLAGATIRIPPLRERGDDVLLLCEHFWQALLRKYPDRRRMLSSEAKLRIRSHSWPGNVRQLRNFLEKLFVLASNDPIDVADLNFTLQSEAIVPNGGGPASALAEQPDDYREARRQFEVEFFRRQLQRHNGNITHTAKTIGLERQTLQDKLKALQLSAKEE